MRQALAGLTLEIPRGRWVALLGPNGSGKSTLLRVASGQQRPDSGDCHVLDQPVSNVNRQQLGVIFQSTALDPRLSVRENLHDLARLQGLDPGTARQRIEVELTGLGIQDRANDRVATLSGGLARRADLARALLHHPDLLLLDEPTTGLDPLAREAVLNRLAEAHRQGRSIIMSTHLVEEAARAQRVIMLHEGTCVADGAPEDLCHELGPRMVRVSQEGFTPDQPEGWVQRGGTWTRTLSSGPDPVLENLLAAGIDLAVTRPTLADVFAQRSGSVLHAEQEVAT